MQPSPSLSTIFSKLFDLIKKFLASDAVPDFFSTIFHKLLELIKIFLASDAVSDFIHTLSKPIKKVMASDAVSDFFSTIFHKLLELIKRFLASDAVSDFIHMLSKPIKKVMASDAFSDFICKLSDVIQKFMASDAVLYVGTWFKKEHVTAVAVVLVIGLLIYVRCKWLPMTKIAGKTMKAPGQDIRISRKGFEANPSGYFRDLRNKK